MSLFFVGTQGAIDFPAYIKEASPKRRKIIKKFIQNNKKNIPYYNRKKKEGKKILQFIPAGFFYFFKS